MAHILSINISKKKGIMKHPISEARLLKGFGIEGDAHGGDWHRQVSLLSQSSVDKMTAKGAIDLKPGMFAENITIEGLDVHALPIGTQIQLGECLLEVTQIGKECHQHCEIFRKVGDCVMPREGIFAIVLEEGTLRPGDPITVLTKN